MVVSSFLRQKREENWISISKDCLKRGNAELPCRYKVRDITIILGVIDKGTLPWVLV